MAQVPVPPQPPAPPAPPAPQPQQGQQAQPLEQLQQAQQPQPQAANLKVNIHFSFLLFSLGHLDCLSMGLYSLSPVCNSALKFGPLGQFGVFGDCQTRCSTKFILV